MTLVEAVMKEFSCTERKAKTLLHRYESGKSGPTMTRVRRVVRDHA